MDVLYTLLGLVLLAGIAACVIALRRRTDAAAAPLPDEGSLADGQRAGLRDAVESGRRALVQLDDARAAIIACYLAMEGSLAAAGAARSRADTPGEFLARAVADGLVRGAAAGQLTSLFYEARFSGHAMTGAERSTAEVALRQLAADLSEAPAGTAAAGGTTPGGGPRRAGPPPRPGRRPVVSGRSRSPWRGAVPEICVAVAAMAATAAAGYALAGPGAMALVAVLAAACGLAFCAP